MDGVVKMEEREDLEETRDWEELVVGAESGGANGSSEPLGSISYPQEQARWLQNEYTTKINTVDNFEKERNIGTILQ